MRRIILLGASFLALSGTAQARLAAGHALLRSTRLAIAQPTCPAGTPVQAITVVNQAHVGRFALAKVERAMVDQSVQLRAAWGTPCVQFAPGGWRIYLTTGANQGTYYGHFVNQASGVPWATVATSGTAYQSWSSSFSHELVEMLVDPATTRSYTHNPSEGNLEVADPVEDHAYRLDGLWMSDFVLPAWFAGGTDGICATVVVSGVSTVQCDGSPLAAADAPGPYDHMGVLTSPWQQG